MLAIHLGAVHLEIDIPLKAVKLVYLNIYTYIYVFLYILIGFGRK